MSNEITEKFEDRYGSADFEQGKGSNLQKIENRKFGFKPNDSLIDRIRKLKMRGALDEAHSKHKEEPEEEMEDEDEEKKDKEKMLFDPEEEKRIALMQYLNPRIMKSKEKKDFVSRTDVQEQILARLNELAANKLNLMKTAIALDERIKENKIKKDNVTRQIGAHAYIQHGTDEGSMKKTGRAVMSGEKHDSEEVSNLYRNLPNPAEQSAEDLRQQHYALHEESEQLDEANKNVVKQGRTKIIKARVRGGKVQRRKRVSAVKGYTIRGGKLKRMSMAERIRRKRGQRRAKAKKRAKLARALMKRKRSLRKRAALGLKE